MDIIFHVPHSSTYIPDQYRCFFSLKDADLNDEILKMTDWFTDELFLKASESLGTQLVFPISRLLVDPERFVEDEKESMTSVGMGVIYEKTSCGKSLKHTKYVSRFYRNMMLAKYYYPHHKRLFNLVKNELYNCKKVLVVDCHSFPSSPLPYEVNQNAHRADICLGIDEFHTPNFVVEIIKFELEKHGLSVSINDPFSGSLVPIEYLNLNKNILSIMIEVNRRIYLNEINATKLPSFEYLRNVLLLALTKVSKYL